MINVVICDDDKLVGQTLTELLGSWYSQQQISVASYTSGEMLLRDIAEGGKVDIVLMDVELNGKNGVEEAGLIYDASPKTSFVFITAHSRYFQEIFTGKVDPCGFLTKPVQPPLLRAVMDKLITRLYLQGRTLLLDCREGAVVVNTRDILYVESKGHNLTVHLPRREYVLRSTLDAFEQRLPEHFARIHKSYLVNCNVIREFSLVDVGLENEKRLPVSRAMRTAARHKFLQVRGMEL